MVKLLILNCYDGLSTNIKLKDTYNEILKNILSLIEMMKCKEILAYKMDNTTEYNNKLLSSLYLRNGLTMALDKRLVGKVTKLGFIGGYTLSREELSKLFEPNDSVYIVGVGTDTTILGLCMNLLSLGVAPKVVSNCCMSFYNSENHNIAIKLLKTYLGDENIKGEI